MAETAEIMQDTTAPGNADDAERWYVSAGLIVIGAFVSSHGTSWGLSES